MNNEGYVEELVKAPVPKGIWFLGILGCLITIASVVLLFFSALGFFTAIAGIVLIVISFKFREVEYEYLYLNDSVDISRISRKSNRRDVYHFENSNISLIAPKNSIFVDNIRQKERGVTVKDYSGLAPKNDPEHVYSFMVNKGNSHEEVRMMVSDKSMKHLEQFFKDKIKE